jgi:transposase
LIGLLRRHEIQVLLRAGHKEKEVSERVGVSERSVRRIKKEGPVSHVDDHVEVCIRGVGRPSKTAPYREDVKKILAGEPGLMSLEILRRVRERGYDGGKSAMYRLIAELRPRDVDVQMRFEGLPGEFSQHDFGEVNVRFIDGTVRKIRFFASRLKWSRWVEVDVVPNQQVEVLVRTVLDHFEGFGGVPLCAVFDRPKTVALEWKKNGAITKWNPVFAQAAFEIGFVAEVCWPYRARQKGSVENLVKWVKGSFFKQRRFRDMDDLEAQLAEWKEEVNFRRPSRATGEIPAERRKQELPRLRPSRVKAEDLALRIPIFVGPTAEVLHDTHLYSMPPEATGLSGTLYLYRDRVRIVAGRFEAEHERQQGRKKASRLPQHRAAHLAAISGRRGKRYLKRQQIFEVGESAIRFLTELVHRKPRAWAKDIDRLHTLLQCYGSEPLERSFDAAMAAGTISVEYVARCLGENVLPFDRARDEEAG